MSDTSDNRSSQNPVFVIQLFTPGSGKLLIPVGWAVFADGELTLLEPTDDADDFLTSHNSGTVPERGFVRPTFDFL